MEAPTELFTTHVPLPLAHKIDAAASRLDKSRGWVVKQAISAWLDQEEEHHRMTLEALADVDAGHFISNEEVQAWADSLTADKLLPPPSG